MIIYKNLDTQKERTILYLNKKQGDVNYGTLL